MNNNQQSKHITHVKTIFPHGSKLAFQLITDPLQYSKIHPLIQHVEKTGPKTYICHEFTNILIFPYRFQYQVTLDTNAVENIVTMVSEVRKGIILKLRFSMKKMGIVEELTEEIQVWGPSIIRNILMRKLKKVHRDLHENVKVIINTKLNF